MKKVPIERLVIGGLVIGALLASGVTYFSSRLRKEPVQAPVVEQPAAPVQPQPTSIEYTVQTGDYLSRIVYDELGLRGQEIYNIIPGIQERSGLGSERDVYMMVDGNLVEGKDGFVDLIYPGERLSLR